MDNVRIILTTDEADALNKIQFKHTNPYNLVVRAKVILASTCNKRINTIASELGLSYNTAAKWIWR